MPDFGPPVHFLASIDGTLVERELPESPAVTQPVKRSVLIGVRSAVENDLWHRIVTERWLSDSLAESLRSGKPITHESIEQATATAERNEIIKFGAPLGVVVESDKDSTDARGFVAVPDQRIPLPIRAIYTPSIAPAWNGLVPSRGKFLIGEGIAAFTCPFMAAPDNAPDSAIVTFASPTSPTNAAGFTYSLKLTGGFTLTFDPGTRLPRTCQGNYSLMVDGGLTGTPPVRLIDHKIAWAYDQIQLKETEDDVRKIG